MDDITYEDLPEDDERNNYETESGPDQEQLDEPVIEEESESLDVISSFVKDHPAQLSAEGWADLPEPGKSTVREGGDHPLGGMHSQSGLEDETWLDEQTRQPYDEVEKAPEVIPSPPTEQGTATPEAVTGQASNDVDIPPSQPEETYTSQEVQPLASEESSDPLSEPAEITTTPAFTAPTEPVALPAETEFIRPVEADAAPQIEQAPAPVVGQIEPGLGNFHPFTIQDLAQVAGEAVSYQLASKKIALVLSGGGARGAFQVGAEKYAREAKGYHWNIIAGVSVGAMNGAMLAMHRYDRLLEIWQSISNDQVYTGGFNLLSLVKIVFGARSFYGNGPLQKLMQGEFAAGRIIEDLRVGAVSLVSGRYVQFTKESLELSKAILASASIPVVWPPVDVSSDDVAMVDGGVRNITPVGDVLALEPDEIVIINCGNARPPATPGAAANVLSIGMRTLDIMQNEIFINDMKEFLRINALVREAEQQGVVLHHPKTGRPLKYYPCQVIEPDDDLGEVLDFSQGSVQASLRAGVRRAREVLGRP